MKRLKEMKGQGFYLLEGLATANTLFFEDSLEMEKFQRLTDYYLKSFFYIKEYCLNEDGWRMLVKVKDSRTIESNFNIFKSKSKSRKTTFEETWEKLSEMIRICLNQYSRWVNLKRGRTGSLVGEVYKRYYFENLEEAISEITNLREAKIDLSQKVERFRPDKSHFDCDKEISKNQWYRTSKLVQEEKKLVQEIGLKCLYLWEVTDSVVQDLVNFTRQLYDQNFTKNHHNNNPSSIKN